MEVNGSWLEVEQAQLHAHCEVILWKPTNKALRGNKIFRFPGPLIFCPISLNACILYAQKPEPQASRLSAIEPPVIMFARQALGGECGEDCAARYALTFLFLPYSFLARSLTRYALECSQVHLLSPTVRLSKSSCYIVRW